MASEKCPNCGAHTPSHFSSCEYCGTPLIANTSSVTAQDTPSGVTAAWLSPWEGHLPPPSSANPRRSEMVLVCDDVSIISACYDFKKKDWFNDEILVAEGLTMMSVSYWMPLTYRQDDSRWIPVGKKLPIEPSEDDADWSVPVLTCIKGPQFNSTIMTVQLLFFDNSWSNPSFELKDGDDSWAPTHWMPMPKLPE